MFPGNQLLLFTEGVQVRATDEGVKQIETDVLNEMHWLDRGARSVESTISHRYSTDPMVMRLLDLYLAAVKQLDEGATVVKRTNQEPDTFKPWPNL